MVSGPFDTSHTGALLCSVCEPCGSCVIEKGVPQHSFSAARPGKLMMIDGMAAQAPYDFSASNLALISSLTMARMTGMTRKSSS